jgi:enoyl-CoA hydratase/carnithine racemase
MSFITKKFSNGFEYWIISRPDRRNAIGLAIANEILQLACDLEAKFKAAHPNSSRSSSENLPRALVIRAIPSVSSQGRRIWIAGGDLKELSTLDRSEARHYAHMMTASCSVLERLPIPVIAVLEGSAIGGGAEFFLAADIRLATKDSSLEFRQLNVGLCCGYGGTARLIRLCGYGHSQRLILTGAQIDSDEAQRLGLIHVTAATSAEIELECDQILKGWSKISRQALAAQKQLFFQTWQSDSALQISEELRLFTSIWKNPEHLEFLSKFKI